MVVLLLGQIVEPAFTLVPLKRSGPGYYTGHEATFRHRSVPPALYFQPTRELKWAVA